MSDHVSETSPRVAVLDIDGVLADVRHRLHHIAGARRDWDAFFSEVDADAVLPEGRAEAERAIAAGLGIVYLTGRPDRCRQDTVRWMSQHGLPEGDLLMRRDTDRRPARLLKVEALRAISRDREVAYLVDDDADVQAAVSAAGYEVVAADWMHRDEERADPLHVAQEMLGRS